MAFTVGRLAFHLTIVPRPPVDLTPADVLNNTQLKVFGDDNIHNPFDKRFGLRKLAEFVYQTVGMRFVDPEKTGDVTRDFQPIEEVQFLKRYFRLEGGIMFAPLQSQVLYEIVNWVVASMDPTAALLQNMSVALMEAFMHGRTFHSKMRQQFLSVLNEEHIDHTHHAEFSRYCDFDSMMAEYLRGDINSRLWTGQSAQSTEVPVEVNTPVSDQKELTTFQDVAPVSSTERPVFPPYILGTNPYPTIDLSQVLSRVYSVPITWASTNAQNSVLYTADLPSLLIDTYANVTNKLSFFQWFRSGVRCSVRVNGTQFHAGKVMIGWMPHWTASTKQNPVENVYDLGQLNHELLSPNTNETVEFVVPYVGPNPFINLSHTYTGGMLGKIWVMVLHPLILANSATIPPVTVTLNLSFEKPEAAGPTTFSVSANYDPGRVFPSGYRGQSKRSSSVSREMKEVSKSHLPTISPPRPEAPQISSVMQSVGSALSAAESVASLAETFTTLAILGKPTNIEGPTNVINDVTASVSVADGSSPAAKLSLDSTNHVSTTPDAFNGTVDEMSIAHINKIPALIWTNEFTSNRVPGDLLMKLPVCPTMCYWHAVGDDVHYHMPPYACVANCFTYWKGGMNFLLKITCPSFITGRIRLFWMPSPDHIPSDLSEGGGDFISRVIDFTGDTQVTFSVPYFSENLYKRTIMYHTVSDPTEAQAYYAGNLEQCNGMIMLFVQNAFTSGYDLTLSKVYLALYAAPAADMSYYHPKNFPLGLNLVNPGLPKDENNNNSPKYRGQSSQVVENTTNPRSIFQGEFEPIINSGAYQLEGIAHGEEVSSIKQLLLRPVFHDSQGSAAWGPYDWRTSSYANFFNVLSRCYQFCRGGIRVHGYLASVDSLNWPSYNVWFSMVDQLSVAADVDNNDPNSGTDPTDLMNGAYISNLDTRKFFHVEVPYYSDRAFYPTYSDVFPADAYPVQMLTYRCLSWFAGTVSYPTFSLYISAADDFTLGWLKNGPHMTYTLPAPKKTTSKTLLAEMPGSDKSAS